MFKDYKPIDRSKLNDANDALTEWVDLLRTGADPTAVRDYIVEAYHWLQPKFLEQMFEKKFNQAHTGYQPPSLPAFPPDTDRQRDHFAGYWHLRSEIIEAQNYVAGSDYAASREQARWLAGWMELRPNMLGTPFRIGSDVYIYAGLSEATSQKPILCFNLEWWWREEREPEVAKHIYYAYHANTRIDIELARRDAEKNAERQACRGGSSDRAATTRFCLYG